jgi:hypothetical protein
MLCLVVWFIHLETSLFSLCSPFVLSLFSLCSVFSSMFDDKECRVLRVQPIKSSRRTVTCQFKDDKKDFTILYLKFKYTMSTYFNLTHNLTIIIVKVIGNQIGLWTGLVLLLGKLKLKVYLILLLKTSEIWILNTSIVTFGGLC